MHQASKFDMLKTSDNYTQDDRHGNHIESFRIATHPQGPLTQYLHWNKANELDKVKKKGSLQDLFEFMRFY